MYQNMQMYFKHTARFTFSIVPSFILILQTLSVLVVLNCCGRPTIAPAPFSAENSSQGVRAVFHNGLWAGAEFWERASGQPGGDGGSTLPFSRRPVASAEVCHLPSGVTSKKGRRGASGLCLGVVRSAQASKIDRCQTEREAPTARCGNPTALLKKALSSLW